MPTPAHRTRSRVRRLLNGAAVVLVALTPVDVGAAQSPPPVNGTIALEGTMGKFYRAVNVVVVTTVDGVEHVYRFAKDLIVHGGKRPGVDALEDLHEGATVVVHYTVESGEAAVHEIDVVEGLSITEGTVTRIERGHHKVTVNYDNGSTETFQLTERAAEEAGRPAEPPPTGTKVVIYYSDHHGQKVAHFFRKLSQ